MTKNPEKDFEPIAADYAFFEAHATEAEEDARAYLEGLGEIATSQRVLRMLDFGCGSGTFTARFLKQLGRPPEQLRLTLIEPVESARRQAVARLAGYIDADAAQLAKLPTSLDAVFDIVLANHVLYYVDDLQDQLATLIGALSTSGVFLAAIAARTNALIEFWISSFRLIGEEIPHNTSEDVETALGELGVDYQKQQVPYELTFPDTNENRMRIIRFLLSKYLEKMPQRPLLDWFDRFSHAGHINIRSACDHFTIRSR
jgi:trans-aconitate 2-methyltransferase